MFADPRLAHPRLMEPPPWLIFPRRLADGLSVTRPSRILRFAVQPSQAARLTAQAIWRWLSVAIRRMSIERGKLKANGAARVAPEKAQRHASTSCGANRSSNPPSSAFPISTWRAELQRSHLPALTKLVCFNLSLYMEAAQAGCSPSMRDQMRDTGLGLRTLAHQLQIAQAAGYLAFSRVVNWGTGRAVNTYAPMLPGSLARASGAGPDIPPASFLPARDYTSGRGSTCKLS